MVLIWSIHIFHALLSISCLWARLCSFLTLLTNSLFVCLLLQSWSFLWIPNLFPAALRSVLVSLFSIRGCSLLLFCHLPYKKNKLFLRMKPSSFLSYYSNLPASVCYTLGSLLMRSSVPSSPTITCLMRVCPYVCAQDRQNQDSKQIKCSIVLLKVRYYVLTLLSEDTDVMTLGIRV